MGNKTYVKAKDPDILDVLNWEHLGGGGDVLESAPVGSPDRIAIDLGAGPGGAGASSSHPVLPKSLASEMESIAVGGSLVEE